LKSLSAILLDKEQRIILNRRPGSVSTADSSYEKKLPHLTVVTPKILHPIFFNTYRNIPQHPRLTI